MKRIGMPVMISNGPQQNWQASQSAQAFDGRKVQSRSQ